MAVLNGGFLKFKELTFYDCVRKGTEGEKQEGGKGGGRREGESRKEEGEGRD